MLTAFQARKARMQPHNNVVDDQTPSPLPDASASPPGPLRTERVPKRKPRDQDVAQDTDSKNNKRRKSRGANKLPRYFDIQDEPMPPKSTTIIAADDDISMSDLEDDGLIQGSLEPIRTEPRAWSPSQPFHDTSSDESSESSGQDEMHNASQIMADQTPVLSSFTPQLGVNTFHLSADEFPGTSNVDATVLFVPVSQSVAFIGVYSLTIVMGIFAPRSAPVPVLESIDSHISHPHHLLDLLPERMRSFATNQHAVLLLRELKTGVEGLGRIIRTFERVFLPPDWQATDPTPYLGIPGVYMWTCKDRDLQSFIFPSSWDIAMSSVCLNHPPREDNAARNLNSVICFIKGPKNSGKSTFARTLINKLTNKYQKVAFLDCDPGQSEFTPSGMVSLHVISEPIFGPPFTHPSIPRASHFIGSPTPRSSPSHYLTAVQSLLQTYRLDIEYATDDTHHGDTRISDITPLVVNTMGWVKGLGADLNNKIEELIKPTDVFDLCLPPAESISSTLACPVNFSYVGDRRVHPVSAIPSSVVSSRYTPADHRALSALSYFHSSSLISDTEHTVSHWDTSLPLCAKSPYEVDFKLAFDKFVLVMSGMEDVIVPEIQRVLNGAVVALVECLEECNTSTTQYIQGSSPPSPLVSNCVGLGLIRSLSPEYMYIITPVPQYLLARCRVLVKGEVELPVWGMLDFRSENGDAVAGVERSRVPYLRWGKGEGLGGDKRRIRRNLMRKGQL